MPPLATGRSREITVSCVANLVWNTATTEGDTPYLQHTDLSSAHAAGFAAENLSLVCDSDYEEDLTYTGPHVGRFRPRIWVTVSAEGGGPAGGFSLSATSYWLGEWLEVDFTPVSTFAGFLSGSASATASGALSLEEWIDDGIAPYEECAAATSSLSVGGSGTVHAQVISPWNEDGFEEVFLSASASDSGSDTNLGPWSNFSHQLDMSAHESISASALVGGPGISHTTHSFSATSGSSAASGDTNDATLTCSDPDNPGTLTTTGNPDWAMEATVHVYSYDGSPMEDVECYIEPGTAGSPTATDGTGQAVLQYPVGGGLTSSRSYSLGGSGGAVSDTRTAPLLDQCGSVRISEEWANSYGCFLKSSLAPSFSFLLHCLAPFTDAGTFSLDDSHEYSYFHDGADFDGGAMDGGTWSFAGEGTVQAAAEWLPVGYRYFKIRAKAAETDATFTIRLDRSLGTVFGAPRSALYEWTFRVDEADTWKDFILDIAFPHFMQDDVYTFVGLPPRYVFHPALMQDRYEAAGEALGLSLVFGTDTTWHFESLTGYLREADGGETRTKATLHSPLAAYGFAQSDQLAAQDAPIVAAHADAWRQGSFWGRLVSNGVLALDLGNGQYLSDWPANRDLYDAASVDTGLHFTAPAGDLAEQTAADGAYLFPTGGETGSGGGVQVLNTGVSPTTLTLRAIRRFGTFFGYYGMGDPVSLSYGATLSFHAEQVLDGALEGLVWEPGGPVVGASLDLLDNSSESVVATVTTDDDGFWKVWPIKYGVRRPLDNLDHSHEYTESLVGSVYQPPTYTALGEDLNSYWVRGDQLQYRDDEDIARYSAADYYGRSYSGRQDLAVLNRYLSHYDLSVFERLGGVWACHTRFGRLLTVYQDPEDLAIKLHRADFPTPPYADTFVVSEASEEWVDSEPRVAADPNGPVFVIFTRQPTAGESSVQRVRSDDDGETWGEAVEMFAGDARHGTECFDRMAEVWFWAAWREESLVGRLQYAGDPDPRDEVTFQVWNGSALVTLVVANDTFHVTASDTDPTLPWVLVCRKPDRTVGTYASYDHGATWTEKE